MNIALLEDDPKTASFLKKAMEENGYQVAHFIDGRTALAHLQSENFDLAILDIMVPGIDGLAVLAALRNAGRELPVIILSARDSVQDKIRGLESGSDDYMTKPFSVSELLARIQAVLRRKSNWKEPSMLNVADLSMDLLSRKVTRAGQKLDLRPQEFMLLEYLMRNAGRVVSKSMILEHVWEYHFDPQTNVVETHMCRLREQVDKNFERKLIQTVRGFGYVLE